MATTVIRFFDEVSTARQALDALAAQGFPRDAISLIAHQEHVDSTEAMSGWTLRVVAVPGVGPMMAIGPVAAALSGMTGEVAGESLIRVLMDRGAPSGEARACVEGVRGGGVLVLVDTDEVGAERAGEALRHWGSGDQGALAASWQRAGGRSAPP
jgi:hypothetical protein